MKNTKTILAILLIIILGGILTFMILNLKGETKSIISNDTTSNNSTAKAVSGKIYLASDIFTNRDLEQTADLSSATYYTLENNNDIHITQEGVYVIKGTASNVTIYVESGSEDKVQIVLDGANITNTNFPCIYVKTADKVFVTTGNDSSLVVSGTFNKDGDTNTDGVIFSKSDITLNGTATLTIKSTDNGIVGKDDIKITGGTYNITATSKTIEANDSICISDGNFNLNSGTDGLHAENDEDTSLGYIFITGGDFTINAKDDAIHGNSVVQIDDGKITITSAEGIEGTYIQINGGTININATDDGINAAKKTSSYNSTIEINDGSIKVAMGAGDTDGIDSNGDIYVNGGTIDVTGNSAFDYDGKAEYNGGTIIVNGTQVNSIPNQMMGGGMNGGQQNGGQKQMNPNGQINRNNK